MKKVIFKSVPFDKTLITLALESGVDAVMVEKDQVEAVKALGRVTVITPEDMPVVELTKKADEDVAIKAIQAGKDVVLKKGWEIIPVENILAQVDSLALECESLDRAILAAGILERGCDTIVVLPEGAADLKQIVAELKLSQGTMELSTATVTAIEATGLGHRVCVDTISMLKKGQGMLIGNSSAFSFLVHAETESNPYVAARPSGSTRARSTPTPRCPATRPPISRSSPRARTCSSWALTGPPPWPPWAVSRWRSGPCC